MNAMQGMDRCRKEVIQVSTYKYLNQGSVYLYNTYIQSFDHTAPLSFQIIVSEDGVCGMNYEHTTSEGVAVVTMIQEILKNMTGQIHTTAAENSHKEEQATNFSRIEWNLNEDVKEAITTAAQNINRF